MTVTPLTTSLPAIYPVITFTIEGEPAPKKRPRFVPRKKKGGGTYMAVVTDDQTIAAENWVLAAFRNAYPGWEPLPGLVGLECEFYSRSTHTQRAGRTDTDNLIKLVSDALNEVCWADDSQVVEIHAVLTREYPDEPYTVVRVFDLEVQP